MSKIGYFELFDGCSGDMLAGSLVDAGLDIVSLKKELKKLPVENYRIEIKKVNRKTQYGHMQGGSQFLVIPNGKWNDETPYSSILKIIEKSSFSPKIKEKIIKVFDTLAEGESIVHKEEKDKIHFHQVGQIDAIIEITSVIVGIEILEIEEVFSSPVGISNIAPATIEILKGVPTIPKNIPFEITTPTGAAIIKSIANFSPITSDFYIYRFGYGAGTKEFPPPNMVKFMIGRIENKKDSVIIIETNIDDISPVFIGHLIEKLYNNGALDVSVFSGVGKKNRPVFKLEVILPESNFKKISEIIFKESTTIGFRYRKENRIVLEREVKTIKTPFGNVRVKTSYINGKVVNVSPEYEDCKKISEKKQIPLKKIYQTVYKNLENNLK
ncbi:MAG: nickel pincer cofactor biosynthesis protein LarC [Candidatus Omnitrophica bacterium]|nr:nickel pincer cofactor biosynthesis protein LarC [Candidatus Omnitrophota bacterium]